MTIVPMFSVIQPGIFPASFERIGWFYCFTTLSLRRVASVYFLKKSI